MYGKIFDDVGIYLVAGISSHQFHQQIFINFVFRTRMKLIIDNKLSIIFGTFKPCIYQFKLKHFMKYYYIIRIRKSI